VSGAEKPLTEPTVVMRPYASRRTAHVSRFTFHVSLLTMLVLCLITTSLSAQDTNQVSPIDLPLLCVWRALKI